MLNESYASKLYSYFTLTVHSQLLLDDWVKIDSSYPWQQKEKERLLSNFGLRPFFVSNEDASTDFAKNEFFQLLIDHLPQRFPDKFERRDGGIYNQASASEWFLNLLCCCCRCCCCCPCQTLERGIISHFVGPSVFRSVALLICNLLTFSG